ncbi:Slam-dependent surface lipoprotein [Neisseria subflava]|uniref:Slam-dependent surface lipoprotein n=1 Tax=Neisseria subflava TaxID=28449 RepID=A0AAW6Y9N3_NEISU|nr:Slam-dependent surface lipoprotein [Neisseria subflava]MDK7242042.1 Slam-dependent surface lipoprotein [Neisseria subflava]
MSIFKQTLLAAVLCGVFGVAVAAPDGGSSELKNVKPGQSDAIPFGAGKAGLRFVNGGNWSASINLQNGPVQHIRNKYNDGKNPINGTDPYANVDGTRNSQYLMLRDVAPVIGWFYNPKLGQVWYENRHNNTEVYSVRQITEPKLFFAPKFSGLVIAKVPGMSEGNNVFFGEWAPRAGNPPKNSTDLNMADGKRTVWYVGDNPTGNTAGLGSMTYNVVGINKHTPGRNDFYTGSVTARFGTAPTGTMEGSISHGDDHIDFNNARITNKDGTFADQTQGMTGRFYGSGAAAMAGYTTRGTAGVGDDVAFGGRGHASK